MRPLKSDVRFIVCEHRAAFCGLKPGRRPVMQRPTDLPFLPGQQSMSSVRRTGFVWLVAAAVVTVILWQLPGGNYVLYPFTILATWFHEMAHGLAALLLGGRFAKLLIFSDGSGVAYYAGPLVWEPVSRAVVAAAGPMGPPLAGAALIYASRSMNAATLGLKVLGGFLVVSAVIWVRSLFGLAAIPAIGLAVLVIAFMGSAGVRVFSVQFLGVQACVSTYRQIDYLFSYSAGPLGISDTAQMQQVLLMPYWFWGLLMTIASAMILIWSLKTAYRS